MSKLFWLRAETKEFEYRRALSPDSVKKLLDAGHKVVVEKSDNSIISETLYAQTGATIVDENAWIKQAPKDAIVVGLKALDASLETYKHTHIYFAHVYKEQDGWQEVMSKFKNGGGKIIDLEYMVDNRGARVCAFGYWAGYVGAALAALFSNNEKHIDATAALRSKRYFIDKNELIGFVKDYALSKGDAIVLGHLGRSGSGAADFFKDINWSVVGWDKSHTEGGGPFEEILNFDVFVNCVLSTSKIKPFLTFDSLKDNNKLKAISDVTCDPDSDCNVLPLYDKATDLDNPFISLDTLNQNVSLVAIDNLPSILPKESTCDFSSQLEKYLINFDESSGPISISLDSFNHVLKNL